MNKKIRSINLMINERKGEQKKERMRKQANWDMKETEKEDRDRKLFF